MFLVIRAITYATLFIGFLLVFLPARVLSSSGIVQPVCLGAPQIIGVVVGASGAALALWCIVTFVVIGRGTPAPFDPPQHLVVVGPYRLVRNPMYIGAALVLAGAALFYESWALLRYCSADLRLMSARSRTCLNRGRWGEGFTAEDMAKCRWLRPRLVVQVEFTEWTPANHLRHPKFVALSDDKEPGEVQRERV